MDAEYRLLRHLLVKVRSEFAGKYDLILAQLDRQVMPREIRVVDQSAMHVGMQSAPRFWSAVAVIGVVGFEGANRLHGVSFFGVVSWQ